jgi:Protein of unknown function (DUF3311)
VSEPVSERVPENRDPRLGAPGGSARPSRSKEGDGLRVNPWNLLLLVPFLMLITPWINSVEPRLFGMPFFYWVQFAFVPVGVICVAVVYLRTRDEVDPTVPGEPGDVDDLDEGALDRGAGR